MGETPMGGRRAGKRSTVNALLTRKQVDFNDLGNKFVLWG
jgi:hypothetical protein